MKRRNKVTLSVGSPHIRESGNFLLVASNNKCFTSVIFSCGSKSYSISPVRHGKSFLPAFLRSLLVTYVITLSLEEEIIVLEKVWNFGSKICTNPTLTSKIRNTGIQYLESGIHGIQNRLKLYWIPFTWDDRVK